LRNRGLRRAALTNLANLGTKRNQQTKYDMVGS
jgi:hypothetical protein